MFDKLLSKIAFNPSHLDEFLVYSNRLKKDKVLRKLSVILITGGILLMMFSFVRPAEKSVTYSPDNIMNGIRTKDDILTQLDNPNSDIAMIYSKFGVTRQDLASLPENPNATLDPSHNGNYWTTLRHLDRSALNNGTSLQDTSITLDINNTLLYMKPMDGTSQKNEPLAAFRGRNSTTGQPFWVLTDTGGYTQIGQRIAKEDPPRPKVLVKKTFIPALPNQAAGGNFNIVYEYRNIVPGSLAQGIVITDHLGPKTFGSLDASDNATVDDDGNLTISLDNVPYDQHAQRVIVRLKSKNILELSSSPCSTFSITSANANPLTLTQDSTSCFARSPDIPVSSIGTATPSVSMKSNILAPQDDEPNEAKTSVSAGDTIEYKLTVLNTSNETIKNFPITDYVGDLLEYGDIDIAELKSQNAQFDPSTNMISWAGQDLASNSETTESFRVHLKDPFPITNRPSPLNFSYDCQITNQYGNATSYKLDCPAVKRLENIPNLSPSAAITISFLALGAATLLYMRNLVLLKEARGIKKIYQQRNNG